MKSELRSLYRRFFYNDAREPTTFEGDLLTKIIPLVSALLLAADSIRRYLEIIAPSEIFKYSQHLLLVVSIVSLIYIATRVRSITPTTTESASPSIEFIYPRKWRNFAKFLFLPILVLYVWGLWKVPEPAFRFAAQNPLAVDVTNYRSNDIAYDLIVQNTGTTQQILTAIGVHSHVIVPFMSCYIGGGGGPLAVVANYTLRFKVYESMTEYPMDPPLAIPPNDAVRFTVSLAPVAIACNEDAKAQVTVFVKNADGASIETKPREITMKDIDTLQSRQFSFEELFSIAAKSNDEYSQADAISRLGQYRPLQNKAQIVSLIIAYLQSPSAAVRSASIGALADLDQTQEVADIISLLKNDPNAGVRGSAAKALGILKNVSSIDVLGLALNYDPDPGVRYFAAVSLGQLGDSKAIGYLMDGLKNEPTERTIDGIIGSLIKLQSVEAIPSIIDTLESVSIGTFIDLTEDILKGDPTYANNFVPTLLEILKNDKYSGKRLAAADELRNIRNNPDVVKALGQSAMADPDPYVRLGAIDTLGTLASPQAIEVLKTIASSQQDPKTKAAAQTELRKLGQ
jgi:HEAT repeat protein